MAKKAVVDNAVNAIRTSMEKERPRNHPIKEHLLTECEEYVQKLYIDALCVIAQYESGDTEKALNFVRRVHAGAGLTSNFAEHIKNAMEITVDRFGEFIRQCTENHLENIFFVDGLLTACADGTPNSKQVDFIAEISDALKISKKNAGHLSELAVSILEQSNEKYQAACDKIAEENRWTLVRNIICYAKEFVQGVLIYCRDILWIYYKEMFEADDNIWQMLLPEDDYIVPEQEDGYERTASNHKEVIIENIKLLYEENKYVEIRNCESFYLKNCYSEINFRLISIINVNINDCQFDLGNKEIKYLFWLDGIINFKFENLIIPMGWYDVDSGCTFRFTNELNFILNNSFFVNIVGSRSGCANGFITCGCAKKIQISGCSFISCKSRSNVMFRGVNYEETKKNNTFENCS